MKTIIKLSTELYKSGIKYNISNGITTNKIFKGKIRRISRSILGDVATSNTSGIKLNKKYIEKI